MPIYEYECLDCENIIEVNQRIADAPLSSCPDCNGDVKKLVSMSSFQLKGGGWYADGYSSTGNSTSAKKVDSSCKKSCKASEGCSKKS